MAEVKVCSFPPNLPLAPIDERLQQMQVRYRIVKLDDRQDLYVDDKDLGAVSALLDQLRERAAGGGTQARGSNTLSRIARSIKLAPVTYGFVITSVAVYLASMNVSLGFWLYWLLGFTEVDLVNGVLTQLSWQQTYLQDHQWWRLLGPVFLHFGVAHIIFNAVAMIEFGRRIEHVVELRWTLAAMVLIGIGSNVAQYWASPAPFGGLSGIAYGLFAWVLSLSMRCDNRALKMPMGFVVMMLITLLLGPLGLIEKLFSVKLANHAHFGGLLLGALVGLIIPYRTEPGRRQTVEQGE